MKYLLPILLLSACSKSSVSPAPPVYNPRHVTLKVSFLNGATATVQSVGIDGKAYGPYSSSHTESVVAPTDLSASAKGGDGTNMLSLRADMGSTQTIKISNPNTSTIASLDHVYVSDTIFVTIYK